MTRYLANTVIFDGQMHQLSIVELSDDCRIVSLMPYRGETHSTHWVDGVLVIEQVDGIYRLDVLPHVPSVAELVAR